jgi:eukaryotic-like serine/threonine-protein kinase
LEFKFRAFLSYSRRDQRTAAWLHKALESIGFPLISKAQLAVTVLFQSKLFPIFRDRDELSSSSDLSLSIQEALRASAYLALRSSGFRVRRY